MKYVLQMVVCLLSIVSIAYGEEMQKEMPVNPQQLFELIEEADRLIVKDSPMHDAEVLFESTDRKDRAALQSSLVIKKPKEWFHCMCIGTPAIYLYKGDRELGLLTNHHGLSVRFSLWSSDARVMDMEKWLTWFDVRKISGPRKEVEEMRIRQEKSK